MWERVADVQSFEECTRGIRTREKGQKRRLARKSLCGREKTKTKEKSNRERQDVPGPKEHPGKRDEV